MSDTTVQLYYSSVGSSMRLKKQQREIEDIIKNRVNVEMIDITLPENTEKKAFMRENSRRPEEGKCPLPPQLFKGEEYLGDYSMFADAVEDDNIDVFLKLVTKTEVSQSQVEVTGGKDD